MRYWERDLVESRKQFLAGPFLGHDLLARDGFWEVQGIFHRFYLLSRANSVCSRFVKRGGQQNKQTVTAPWVFSRAYLLARWI
jgi:hypothetical protein